MNRTGLIIALTISVIFGVLFALHPELDLKIAALFYDAATKTFPLKASTWAVIARDGAMWIAWALVAPAIVAFVVKLIRPVKPLMMSGRAMVFLLVTMLLTAIVLSNVVFKGYWGRPRPVTATEFNGKLDFKPWWDPRGACPKNCSFFSGEGATAFWTYAPAVLTPPAWRPLAYVAATAFGGSVGGEARVTLDDPVRYRLWLTASGVRLEDVAKHHKLGSGELKGLAQGDVLVANNTRVLKARLLGRRLKQEGAAWVLGGNVEFVMLECVGERTWEGLFKASAKYVPGLRFEVPTPDGRGLRGTMVRGSKGSPHGTVVVEFDRDPIESAAIPGVVESRAPWPTARDDDFKPAALPRTAVPALDEFDLDPRPRLQIPPHPDNAAWPPKQS